MNATSFPLGDTAMSVAPLDLIWRIISLSFLSARILIFSFWGCLPWSKCINLCRHNHNRVCRWLKLRKRTGCFVWKVICWEVVVPGVRWNILKEPFSSLR